MEAVARIAMGALAGAVVAAVAVRAVTEGATVSTVGADGTNGPTAGVAVTAPVSWRVLAVGAVAGGLLVAFVGGN